MKLNRLTAEQEAILLAIRDKWLSIGLSTEPADRKRAEAGVALAYQAAGMKPPSLVIWLRSPLEGAYGATLLKEDQVRAQVGAQVGDQVRAQVGDQVRAQVWAQVGAQVGDQVGEAVFGGHDASWLGFYAAFNCFGIEVANKLRGLQEVAQSCGWWWPFADAVILTERPNKILRDDQNRLHCETGPALSYPDGFSIYAWHGTRLPAEWVENRTTIDPAIILKAGNVEQRAAGAALIGWPRMLKVLKEKVVDDSGSPDIGQLIELTLPGLPEPGRFLKAVCPRNGIICEGVPYVSDIDNLPINTALHAQAWRIGDPLSDYQHPPART